MNKLEITDLNTINEIATFEVKGSSYQASEGNHDDLVMNLVLFAWFVSSEAFGNLSDLDFKALLYSQTLKEIEDDLPPVGILQDKSVGAEWYEKHKQEMDNWNNL